MNPQLKTALAEFQDELEKMQAQYNQYIEKPAHNKRYAAYKLVQIRVLQNTVDTLMEYAMQCNAEMQQMADKILKLEGVIFKLESICLLHGVGGSIFTYMQMSENALGLLVKKCYGEGWRQTPLELLADYPKPKPVTRSAKPVPIDMIKIMAQKEPGFLTEIKNLYPSRA